MSRVIHVFRTPDRFIAGTVGQPGERAFYLQAVQEARIVSVSPRGPRTRIGVEIEGQTLDLDRSSHDPIAELAAGRTVRLRPDPFHLFAA